MDGIHNRDIGCKTFKQVRSRAELHPDRCTAIVLGSRPIEPLVDPVKEDRSTDRTHILKTRSFVIRHGFLCLQTRWSEFIVTPRLCLHQRRALGTPSALNHAQRFGYCVARISLVLQQTPQQLMLMWCLLKLLVVLHQELLQQKVYAIRMREEFYQWCESTLKTLRCSTDSELFQAHLAPRHKTVLDPARRHQIVLDPAPRHQTVLDPAPKHQTVLCLAPKHQTIGPSHVVLPAFCHQ